MCGRSGIAIGTDADSSSLSSPRRRGSIITTADGKDAEASDATLPASLAVMDFHAFGAALRVRLRGNDRRVKLTEEVWSLAWRLTDLRNLG